MEINRSRYFVVSYAFLGSLSIIDYQLSIYQIHDGRSSVIVERGYVSRSLDSRYRSAEKTSFCLLGVYKIFHTKCTNLDMKKTVLFLFFFFGKLSLVSRATNHSHAYGKYVAYIKCVFFNFGQLVKLIRAGRAVYTSKLQSYSLRIHPYVVKYTYTFKIAF